MNRLKMFFEFGLMLLLIIAFSVADFLFSYVDDAFGENKHD